MPSEQAPTPPISAELWQRLKKFDRNVAIYFQRAEPFGVHEFKHLPRIWRVSMEVRGGKAHESIYEEHPQIEKALLRAVERAEFYNWDQPHEKHKRF